MSHDASALILGGASAVQPGDPPRRHAGEIERQAKQVAQRPAQIAGAAVAVRRCNGGRRDRRSGADKQYTSDDSRNDISGCVDRTMHRVLLCVDNPVTRQTHDARACLGRSTKRPDRVPPTAGRRNH